MFQAGARRPLLGLLKQQTYLDPQMCASSHFHPGCTLMLIFPIWYVSRLALAARFSAFSKNQPAYLLSTDARTTPPRDQLKREYISACDTWAYTNFKVWTLYALYCYKLQ